MAYHGTAHQHHSVQKFIPFLPLKSQIVRKGSLGRHLSLTGSPRFPGAATFPAMAALKMGVDLTYLLLPPEQNLLLISRLKSNDLMVSPLPLYTEANRELIDFKSFTNNTDSIVFGPGLSRITDLSYKYDPKARTFYKQSVLSQLNILLSSLEHKPKIPIVIDADGIFLITQRLEQIENKEDVDWFNEVRRLFKQLFLRANDRIVLTPNLNEYNYLEKAFLDRVYDVDDDSKALMCLIKGRTDRIGFLTNQGFEKVLECDIEGGLKRCGGLGDCLTGCISSLLCWLEKSNKGAVISKTDYLNGVFSACCIMRLAGKKAFQKHGISTVAEDVIGCIPGARDDVLGDFLTRTVNINDVASDKVTRE